MRRAGAARLLGLALGVTLAAGGLPTAGAAQAHAAPLPLSGRVVVLDPGHNGGNATAAAAIGRQVPDGRGGQKACDTTGTATDAGYPEHAFTWDVALRTAALLRARGARVVLTRADDRGVGPCVDRRAAIGNAAHADLAVSIHADGAPAAGRGFHVILPANGPVVRGSHRLALAIRAELLRRTGTRVADYTAGGDGLQARADLAGLNSSTVPKVFVECANMRNAADARLLTSPAWRASVARALAAGIENALR